MNCLDGLKEVTVVVADTGDFQSINQYLPQDATTNPSLILQASSMTQYQQLVQSIIVKIVDSHKKKNDHHDNANALLHDHQLLTDIMDNLAVAFGCEILKIVPGRVSTEVDARLSFDVQGSIAKARKLIQLYKEKGIDKERILVKLAATWEGIKAAEQLEKEGIHTNLTLLFNFYQAVACADAHVTLISPFVGRILDWYKKTTGKNYPAEEDPGVVSVRQIYNYYKKFSIPTIVMGASFRSVDQILALTGCDYLTISPKLLEELKNQTNGLPLTRNLSPEAAQKEDIKHVAVDENTFRYQMNQDAMATEKLAEGIRTFAKDIEQLESVVLQKLATLQ